MDAKELYLLSVKEGGISTEAYSRLSQNEKELLQLRKDGGYALLPPVRSSFRVVLTGGVFDILHMGHALTLGKARDLGDLLVVVVATDARVEEAKGRKPIHGADYRRAMVSTLRAVDLAIVGQQDIMATFLRVLPDIVAFGYDQKPISLPAPAKGVHLADVKADESLAKTSRIIRELGL